MFFLLVLAPLQLAAQAVFDAFGFTKPVVATGQTEVVGSVQLALRQGPTAADTLVIDLSPYRITNASAADLRLTTAGNLTTGTVVIEAAEGRVRIPINAGGTSGSLRVDGIRLAVAGTNATAIDARLSWAGNLNILSSSNPVRVVDQVQSGLSVEAGDDRFLVLGNTVVDSTANFTVGEGFKSAFTNSAEFGQNAPTRLRIRITDLPTGLSFEFPSVVNSSDSAATLTTVEGTSITLPRADGTAEVTYNFNAAANSADVLESFKIAYNVSAQGRVALLQPTIDVTLAPVGTAELSNALASTADIPRFAAEYLNVLEGTSRIITKTMYWTGIDAALSNGIFVSNPSSSATNLILTAYRADGQLLTGANVVNSAKRSLAANQSLEESLKSLFGTSAAIATVKVETTNAAAVALGTATGTGIAESAALAARGAAAFVIPSYDESVRVSVFNPRGVAVSGTLKLLNPEGVALSTKSLTVPPFAVTSNSIFELFPLTCPAVVPSPCYTGYIAGSFADAVVAVESIGTANTLNLISAEPPAELASLYVPFFATGNGFESDLNLISVADETVMLSAQIFNNQGTAVGAPESITLGPSTSLAMTVSQLFKLQGFTTGYIRITVPQMTKGPWTFYPAIQGYVRIRTSQASTIVPISGYPLKDGVVLNSGTAAGEYQGLAIVNPNASNVTVTLDVLMASGFVSQTKTLSLGSNQIVSQVVSQIFSAPVPAGSVIRVTASAPVVTTSVTASLSGDVLRSTTTLK